jgi:hypothetical protein
MGWERPLGASNGLDAQLPAEDRPEQHGWRPGEDLDPVEQEMIARAVAGEPVDRGAGPFSQAEMQAWGDERTVRAAVLRHLLIAEAYPVHAKGVWLRGVRISGRLDLEAATLRCPLRLESCCLDPKEPVCLDYATASRITLTGCRLAGLTGEMLRADNLDLNCSTLTGPLHLVAADITGLVDCHDAHLNGRNKDTRALAAERMKAGVVLLDGLTAQGTIRLAGAVITGQLSCVNAKVPYRDRIGNALSADALKAGGVILDGLTAHGAVRLHGADIAGQLSCRDAQLNGRDLDRNALDAERIKAGAVFLDGKFRAAGAVRLHGADIAEGLSCRGAQLNGTDNDRNALAAEQIKAGVVFLDGLAAAGTVRLYGADITGGLSCHDAQLNGTDNDGNALAADRMTVGSDILLDGKLAAAGTISLISVHVGGSVTFAPTALAGEGKVALNAARSQIAGRLTWKPAAPVSGQVNLEGATAGELDDDWSCKRAEANGYWPGRKQLRLDGFTYGRFGGHHQATAEQRKKWIRSQYEPPAASGSPAFATQPYEQLTAVYRRAGQDTQARDVAIARRADLRRYGKLKPYRRFGNWFLDWTIKYGYQTWRAGVGLAVVFLLFWVFSYLAQQDHLMLPVGETEGLHYLPSATKCTSSYPCFYPFGYTIDTVIPLIDVHQAAYWGPDGHAPLGHAWVACTWAATAAGWALATLLVAGYTGLVRQD